MNTNMTISGVKVDYSNYIWTWGNAPRGEGRWAFFLGDETEPRYYEGLFSQTRKQAAKDAKAAGYWSVKVGA